MLTEKITKSFDRLQYRIRAKLSKYPILYAIIGGIGIVFFWRGIWHSADDFNISSEASLVIGALILVSTGLFVSEFIGNRLIISGLIGEEKITEKEEGEIKTEETQLKNLQNTLNRLEKKLEHIDAEIEEK